MSGASAKKKSGYAMCRPREHDAVSRRLVARYVAAERCRPRDSAPTQHSARKLRHDISSLRCELRDILSTSSPQSAIPDIPQLTVSLPADLINFEDVETKSQHGSEEKPPNVELEIMF